MNAVPFRQALTAVVVFVLVCSSLVVLDRRNVLEPVRDGLTTVVSPVSDTFSRVTDRAGHRSELERELEETSAERDTLRRENSQLRADLKGYDELQQQLAVSEQHPELTFSSSPANVINRDPTGNQKFVIIDQGSRDGITVGAAIVDPNYYIGQVVEVTERTSKVMLLIDSSQKVGAMLQETGADGVVYGQWQLGGVMVMRNIETDKIPKEGEWIVTSGFSESQTVNIPPNLPIGQVVGEAKANPQSDQLELSVRPGRANFDDINVVWVVTASARN